MNVYANLIQCLHGLEGNWTKAIQKGTEWGLSYLQLTLTILTSDHSHIKFMFFPFSYLDLHSWAVGSSSFHQDGSASASSCGDYPWCCGDVSSLTPLFLISHCLASSFESASISAAAIVIQLKTFLLVIMWLSSLLQILWRLAWHLLNACPLHWMTVTVVSLTIVGSMFCKW